MSASKYTREVLREAVEASVSYAGVLRFLGTAQAGGNHSHIRRAITKFGIDTSHFTGQGWNRGGSDPKRKAAEQIFVIMPEGSNRPKVAQLRRAMNEVGIKSECVLCGVGEEWNGSKLVLEVDHFNRNWLDNRQENLRFLCPNCHSQQ